MIPVRPNSVNTVSVLPTVSNAPVSLMSAALLGLLGQLCRLTLKLTDGSKRRDVFFGPQ
jgi:hypothetical protein